MGRAYIKPVSHENFYILWSSVLDGPVAWGTRERLWKLRKKEVGKANREYAHLQFDNAIYRANQTSCSDRIDSYSWDEDYAFGYMDAYTIKRSNLRKLVKLIGKNYNWVDSRILALTEKVED